MTMSASAANDTFAFLVIHRSATLRFDATAAEIEDIVSEMAILTERLPAGDHRAPLRELVRLGMLDDAHLDAARSQPIVRAAIYLCMTSGPHTANPDARGYILEMTDKPDGSANFRFAAAQDREMVDEFTAKARKGLKYVVTVTPEQAAKATLRKRTPPPRDPSLEAPPKPRPERWLPALEAAEKAIGRGLMRVARDCLEKGAMFVWKSRAIEDTAQEEIDASLEAMATHDRLHLPFPLMWMETRDWIEVPRVDAPAERLPARFAIAAAEQGSIGFWGFVEVKDRMVMALLNGTVDHALLSGGRRHFNFERMPGAVGSPGWDEAAHRRIARACGERLLELLFLLSTQGVVKDKVLASGGKPSKQKAAQRRMSARDYTVVRVPMRYLQDDKTDGTGGGGSGGRWVRPHVRRAHMWGKNTRPVEEQHWRDACLVGAAKVGEDVEIRRPEYRVG